LKHSITVDRELATQQDLTKFEVAVLLIRERTNRLEDIRPLAVELLEKLPRASSGELTIVGA
jgi:homoserine trans-succinylase